METGTSFVALLAAAETGRALGADIALLVAFVAFATILSFVCSLFEAVLLSAGTAGLLERKKAGNRGAGLLLDLKQTRIDDALSAILILNTTAHTVGAFMAGAQALVLGLPEGLVAAAFTLVILLLSEIAPKSLGTSYAIPLSAFVGRGLAMLMKAMYPVLFITRALTRWLPHGDQPEVSRQELVAFIEIAAGAGVLKGHEQKLMSSMLGFRVIRVSDVMTPRSVVEMLPASTTLSEFLTSRRVQVFSRIPIYADNFDDIEGYVLAREVLLDALRGADRTRTLVEYKRKIWFIPELASIEHALHQFLERREHIAIALDEHGGVSGLVSLEDIVETILGVEIVDEKDRVADMRRVAGGLRDRRLDRMRQAGQLPEAEEPSSSRS